MGRYMSVFRSLGGDPVSHLTHEAAKARRERIAELMRGANGCPPMTRKAAVAIIDWIGDPKQPEETKEEL
jgi:hypothetical protein